MSSVIVLQGRDNIRRRLREWNHASRFGPWTPAYMEYVDDLIDSYFELIDCGNPPPVWMGVFLSRHTDK